jgi:hypothetical protein
VAGHPAPYWKRRSVAASATAPAPDGPANEHHQVGDYAVKNCKLCQLSKVCNDLPGFCLLIPYLTIALVVVSVGYLFVTQELLI